MLDSSLYSYFKHQMHHAAENALAIYPRSPTNSPNDSAGAMRIIEEFMLDDADYVIRHDQFFCLDGQSRNQTFAQLPEKKSAWLGCA